MSHNDWASQDMLCHCKGDNLMMKSVLHLLLLDFEHCQNISEPTAIPGLNTLKCRHWHTRLKLLRSKWRKFNSINFLFNERTAKLVGVDSCTLWGSIRPSINQPQRQEHCRHNHIAYELVVLNLSIFLRISWIKTFYFSNFLNEFWIHCKNGF